MRKRRLSTETFKFVVALCLLALVTGVLVTSWNDHQQSDQKSVRIGELIALLQTQNTEFARDRLELLNNQAGILAYMKSIENRDRNILSYLKAHGIKIPVKLLEEITPPTIVMVPSGKSTSKKVKSKKVVAPGQARKGKVVAGNPHLHSALLSSSVLRTKHSHKPKHKPHK